MKNKTLTDAATTCFVIQTGHPDRQACFYPTLYRLSVQQDGTEQIIDLGYSGSRLLERLLLNPGKLVSRDELLAYAWTDRIVSQGSLNQQIHTLRQLLADEKSHDVIQTLPRRGYLFNSRYLLGLAPVTRQACSTPADMPPLNRRVEKRRKHWAVSTFTGLAGLALGAAGLSYGYSQLSQLSLISTEMNGGKAYILYVNKSEKTNPQDLVVQRNLQQLGLEQLD
jgi:DNA-binding winged helix-turn-helix (wHTH) protein